MNWRNFADVVRRPHHRYLFISLTEFSFLHAIFFDFFFVQFRIAPDLREVLFNEKRAARDNDYWQGRVQAHALLHDEVLIVVAERSISYKIHHLDGFDRRWSCFGKEFHLRNVAPRARCRPRSFLDVRSCVPRTTDIFMGLTNAVGAGAGLTNLDWTPQYFAVFITLFTLSALQTIVAPQASGDAWGMKREDTPEKNDRFLLLAQGFGHFLLGLEMHSALLLKGVEPAQAIALASLSGWLHFVDALLVRKKAFTIAKPPGYLFWMLYFSASIPFIVLLGEKTVDTILEE